MRVRLYNTDDWIDSKTAKVLARWRGRPNGKRWGLIRAKYSLLRTPQGTLVTVVPGWCVGIPYYMTVPLTTRHMKATPEEVVNLMATTGGMKKAHQLFPELVARWQPEQSPGKEV